MSRKSWVIAAALALLIVAAVVLVNAQGITP